MALSPVDEIRRAWSSRRPYQTVSWAIGAALIVGGLVHLAVFAFDTRPWAGPVSWRKPATFGLSFGLTTLTLAWISGLLRYRRMLAVATLAVAVGSLVEVSLVAMQAWRGVPSHFNQATGFDSAVFSLMGITVAVIAAGIVVITFYAFRSFDADPAMVVGVRVGLLVLLAAQALGAAIIGNGLALGQSPTQTNLATFGEAGAMKVPHAVTMHGIQILPIYALLLASTSLAPRRRRNLMWVGAAGYAGLALASVLQTFQGRAPLSLTPVSGAIVLLSALLGGLAIVGLAAESSSGKPQDIGS